MVLKQKVDIRDKEHFEEKRVFASLFREKGIDDGMRGALWCNLLNINELKNGHAAAFFAKIIEMKNDELDQILDKDTIADRSDLLVDKLTNTYLKPDALKMRKVLFAYGNIDSILLYN